jgi:hypothetical protein
MIRSALLAPNTSMFLQIALAADARLAERQFLYEEQRFNKAESLICRAGTGRQKTVSKTEGQNLESSQTGRRKRKSRRCLLVRKV